MHVVSAVQNDGFSCIGQMALNYRNSINFVTNFKCDLQFSPSSVFDQGFVRIDRSSPQLLPHR